MDSFEAERAATNQLDSDEKLLWSGFPDPKQAALSVLPVMLFGIPFFGFAIFWTVTALHGVSHLPSQAGPWFLFPLFGLPFVFVGLGVLTTPLWAFLAAQRTVYAVTDKRVILIGGAKRGGVVSFTANELGDFARTENTDGSGTLWFGWRAGANGNGVANRARIGFVGIPGVRAVEQLIRDNVLRHAA